MGCLWHFSIFQKDVMSQTICPFDPSSAYLSLEDEVVE